MFAVDAGEDEVKSNLKEKASFSAGLEGIDRKEESLAGEEESTFVSLLLLSLKENANGFTSSLDSLVSLTSAFAVGLGKLKEKALVAVVLTEVGDSEPEKTFVNESGFDAGTVAPGFSSTAGLAKEKVDFDCSVDSAGLVKEKVGFDCSVDSTDLAKEKDGFGASTGFKGSVSFDSSFGLGSSAGLAKVNGFDCS